MPFDASDYLEIPLLQRDPKTLTDPRERLEYLRDFLRELPPERFDIGYVHSVNGELWSRYNSPGARPDPDGCGTAACILGWAQHTFDTDDAWCDELLGVDHDRLRSLYMPDGWDSRHTPFRPTPTQAANVLDHLLKTSSPGKTDGKVDWSVA